MTFILTTADTRFFASSIDKLREFGPDSKTAVMMLFLYGYSDSSSENSLFSASATPSNI